MGCDVDKHRRRRLWEKDQAALASELGGFGFANKGHPAKQVWVEWDSDPIPAFWDWISEYRLLTDTPGAPLVNLNYEPEGTPLGFDLWIVSTGFDQVYVDQLGRPYSVLLNFSCIVTEVEEGVVTLYRHTSIIPLLAPLPTDSYRFDVWANFVNEINIAPVLPGCTVYPLARCHDCSDQA